MTNRSRTGQATDWKALGKPWAFFSLVFALSLPLWILGATLELEMLPGLPIGALMFLCPAIAALILRFSEGGRNGVAALSATVVDYRSLGRVRLVASAILINPVILFTSFWIGRWLGSDAPGPVISMTQVATLTIVFLIASMAEELGWSGYALGPMQRRWGALAASVALGVVWAAWHWPVLHQAGRTLEWMAWWSLWTVSARVIMVWLYNRAGGSVSIVVLYHAASNLSWQLFPVNGSHFDPRITALLTAPVAIALATEAWVSVTKSHRQTTTADRPSHRPTPRSSEG